MSHRSLIVQQCPCLFEMSSTTDRVGNIDRFGRNNNLETEIHNYFILSRPGKKNRIEFKISFFNFYFIKFLFYKIQDRDS